MYLVTAALIGFATFGGMYSVLLNLYLLRLGYGSDFIGLVNGAGLLALALVALPAGAIGERWGSRLAMVAGFALAAAGFGLLPLAGFLPTPVQAAWLVATYVAGSLGLSLYIVNSPPFLMAATNPAERNHVFAVQAALWPLAGFAGSLVAGLLPGVFATMLGLSLNQALPYAYPLLIGAMGLLPGVFVLRATRGDGAGPAVETAKAAGPAPIGLLVVFGLVGLLVFTGEGVARTFFNVYLDARLHTSTATIGLLAALGQLLAVPAALVTPLLVARRGTERTFVVSSWGMALSLLPLALITSLAAAGLGFMAIIATASIAYPALTVCQMELVTPGWRPLMSGVTLTCFGLSWAAAALGGGYVITALGYQSLFLAGAGLTALGVLLFGAYLRSTHRAGVPDAALDLAREGHAYREDVP